MGPTFALALDLCWVMSGCHHHYRYLLSRSFYFLSTGNIAPWIRWEICERALIPKTALMLFGDLNFITFLQIFWSLVLIFRGKGGREREKNQSVASRVPSVGTEPATPVCALTRNWTGGLSVCGTTFNQLSPSSWASCRSFQMKRNKTVIRVNLFG